MLLLVRLRRKLREISLGTDSTRARPRVREARHQGVEVDLARAASRAGDWARACEEWRRVIDQGGGEAPPRAWANLAKALTKLGRVRDALATIVEGRRQHPVDVRLQVEQARLAQRLYRNADEDERHQWKSLLLDAYESLSVQRETGELSVSAMKVMGKASITLLRWSEAADIWAHVAANYPDERENALLQQAVAHRKAGETSEALSILESFAAAAKDARYHAELQRLARHQGRSVADEIAKQIRMRVALGDSSVIREMVPIALALRGEAAPTIRGLVPVIDDLHSFVEVVTRPDFRDGRSRFVARRPEPRRDAECLPPNHGIVVVSGFLYSGSGAVFDFLRDQAGMAVPFGDREPGFLKKPGNFGVLFDADCESYLEPAVIVDMILSSVIGLNQSGRPILGVFQESEESLGYLVRSVQELVAAFLDLWGQDDPCARAQRAVRTFLDGVISQLTPSGETPLMNNVIIGHQLTRVRAFSGGQAIAVVRDPRDQYVSQKLESPYALSCKVFIAMMKQRYDALLGSLESPALQGRVSLVRFEDFVDDPEVRERVLRGLSLSPSATSTERASFRPEVSRSNIGIHQAFSDQTEVQQVTEHLFPRYEALATAL